jgi:hypothetical protein
MSSIGKDLVTIRTHMGLSVDDIQHATKIPLHTLQSIEDGSIFERSDEIQTYIRSFVRTYGRALKLDDELIVQALDQEEIGSYNHLLLRSVPELAADLPEDPQQNVAPKKPSPKPEPSEPEEDSAEAESDPDSPGKRKEPEPVTRSSPAASESRTRNVNWADMGRRMSDPNPGTSVWVIAGGIILIVILAAAYILSTNDFFSSADVDSAETPPASEMAPPEADQNGLGLDFTEEEPEAPAATLDETLYLTVYAAHNVLDPVRVWSDLKPRLDPYWVDQGVALQFEFRDTIRVRGSYDRMLLMLNGHNIENFRQDHFNSDANAVELTRDFFEEDSRWAAPVDFDLPPEVEAPDSVSLRPSF